MKIHVFDGEKLSRHILDPTWPNLAAKSAENDPKMAPQDGSKSVKNGVPKMIKILIEKQPAIMGLGGWPGGLRWALGGKTRGVLDAQDCRQLVHSATSSSISGV